MILPLAGLLFGLAYSVGAGVLMLSCSRKIDLTQANLFAFVCGSFAGAIGFGWTYTQVVTRIFGGSWPGMWELALLAGMGVAGVVTGYLVARWYQKMAGSKPRRTSVRDLEGPIKNDSDWY